ncbi:CBS domain-containing protein [Pelagibius sp. Alg239-R121]|uniref:CBS domain-containing protein n=1 Tax=Pelagibius sp. Alg239-R121 TaxID=2993448 RepID=UPI0024A6F340|nr:CBS domain-containing protein [Pelagibius sp. Alg239-R121]
MTNIKQVLGEKKRRILSIEPDDSVFNAVKMMADNNIGSLIVLENGNLVGIVTERDYSRKVILKGKSSPNTAVKEIMSTQVICVRPEKSVKECMAIMTEKAIRHLPVVVEGEVIGVISIGDLVKSIISDQQFIIDQLEHYIAG